MNHIQSPRTCDASVEEEILRRGLTAPRVTPGEVEANIVSEHYFTAEEGMVGARVLKASFHNDEALVEAILTDDPPVLSLLTFCTLVLRNGFTVTGESACASPENFDAEIGRRIARSNAVQKIWPLMGYALKERLSA